MRILVVFFIAVSAVIAMFQYNTTSNFIAQLMGVSWGALAGSFLAPFLYSLYWKRTTKLSCWICFSFGSVLMLLDMIYPKILPAWMQSPINCGAMAMLIGLVLVPIISLISPKPNKELVDGCFECYNIETRVPQKTALGD